MTKLTVTASRSKGIINKNIYGHFSEHLGRCIYDGLFVGKDSPIQNVNGMNSAVVEALKNLQIPNLRWPGGCFADEYHWRDGIGTDRKRMVNTNWGGVVEDNSFGTHEFMELCRQLGCEPYITGNVGSGTVQEMSEWVEYLNSEGDSTVANERRKNGSDAPFHVRLWGVGNESWGCGGSMRPEYYADVYRRYQTFCRQYGADRLYKIACGPNGDDYNWTDTLMRMAAPCLDAISMHYYTITGGWSNKGSAVGFTRETYFETLRSADHIAAIIDQHLKIMDRYDPTHRVGLVVDEWGTWFDVEEGTNPGFLYQQNTLRDAQVAAISLNIFNDRCDRIPMTNIAQIVNVLQSVILTEGDKILLTPTYHVFDLYKAHQEAKQADTWLTDLPEVEGLGIPSVTSSASVKDGTLTITLSNLDPDASVPMQLSLADLKASSVTAKGIWGEINAHNTFAASPVAIRPLEDVKLDAEDLISITLPPCSVIAVSAKLK